MYDCASAYDYDKVDPFRQCMSARNGLYEVIDFGEIPPGCGICLEALVESVKSLCTGANATTEADCVTRINQPGGAMSIFTACAGSPIFDFNWPRCSVSETLNQIAYSARTFEVPARLANLFLDRHWSDLDWLIGAELGSVPDACSYCYRQLGLDIARFLKRNHLTMPLDDCDPHFPYGCAQRYAPYLTRFTHCSNFTLTNASQGVCTESQIQTVQQYNISRVAYEVAFNPIFEAANLTEGFNLMAPFRMDVTCYSRCAVALAYRLGQSNVSTVEACGLDPQNCPLTKTFNYFKFCTNITYDYFPPASSFVPRASLQKVRQCDSYAEAYGYLHYQMFNSAFNCTRDYNPLTQETAFRQCMNESTGFMEVLTRNEGLTPSCSNCFLQSFPNIHSDCANGKANNANQCKAIGNLYGGSLWVLGKCVSRGISVLTEVNTVGSCDSTFAQAPRARSYVPFIQGAWSVSDVRGLQGTQHYYYYGSFQTVTCERCYLTFYRDVWRQMSNYGQYQVTTKVGDCDYMLPFHPSCKDLFALALQRFERCTGQTLDNSKPGGNCSASALSDLSRFNFSEIVYNVTFNPLFTRTIRTELIKIWPVSKLDACYSECMVSLITRMREAGAQAVADCASDPSTCSLNLTLGHFTQCTGLVYDYFPPASAAAPDINAISLIPLDSCDWWQQYYYSGKFVTWPAVVNCSMQFNPATHLDSYKACMYKKSAMYEMMELPTKWWNQQCMKAVNDLTARVFDDCGEGRAHNATHCATISSQYKGGLWYFSRQAGYALLLWNTSGVCNPNDKPGMNSYVPFVITVNKNPGNLGAWYHENNAYILSSIVCETCYHSMAQDMAWRIAAVGGFNSTCIFGLPFGKECQDFFNVTLDRFEYCAGYRLTNDTSGTCSSGIIEDVTSKGFSESVYNAVFHPQYYPNDAYRELQVFARFNTEQNCFKDCTKGLMSQLKYYQSQLPDCYYDRDRCVMTPVLNSFLVCTGFDYNYWGPALSTTTGAPTRTTRGRVTTTFAPTSSGATTTLPPANMCSTTERTNIETVYKPFASWMSCAGVFNKNSLTDFNTCMSGQSSVMTAVAAASSGCRTCIYDLIQAISDYCGTAKTPESCALAIPLELAAFTRCAGFAVDTTRYVCRPDTSITNLELKSYHWIAQIASTQPSAIARYNAVMAKSAEIQGCSRCLVSLAEDMVNLNATLSSWPCYGMERYSSACKTSMQPALNRFASCAGFNISDASGISCTNVQVTQLTPLNASGVMYNALNKFKRGSRHYWSTDPSNTIARASSGFRCQSCMLELIEEIKFRPNALSELAACGTVGQSCSHANKIDGLNKCTGGYNFTFLIPATTTSTARPATTSTSAPSTSTVTGPTTRASTTTTTMSPTAVYASSYYGGDPWGSSAGFVDAEAMWIWSQEAADASATQKIWINLTTDMLLEESTSVELHYLVQDFAVVAVNGVQRGYGGGWTSDAKPSPILLTLPAGRINISITAVAMSDVPAPAGVVAAFVRASNSSQVLRRTDDTWEWKPAVTSCASGGTLLTALQSCTTIKGLDKCMWTAKASKLCRSCSAGLLANPDGLDAACVSSCLSSKQSWSCRTCQPRLVNNWLTRCALQLPSYSTVVNTCSAQDYQDWGMDSAIDAKIDCALDDHEDVCLEQRVGGKFRFVGQSCLDCTSEYLADNTCYTDCVLDPTGSVCVGCKAGLVSGWKQTCFPPGTGR